MFNPMIRACSHADADDSEDEHEDKNKQHRVEQRGHGFPETSVRKLRKNFEATKSFQRAQKRTKKRTCLNESLNKQTLWSNTFDVFFNQGRNLRLEMRISDIKINNWTDRLDSTTISTQLRISKYGTKTMNDAYRRSYAIFAAQISDPSPGPTTFENEPT